VLLLIRPKVGLDLEHHGPRAPRTPSPCHRSELLCVSCRHFYRATANGRFSRRTIIRKTTGKPRRLETRAAFRFTRNPIYSIFLLPILSLSVYSPVASILAVCIYITTMNRMVIAAEEKAMRNEFGDQYLEYTRRTPRWLFRL